MTNAKAKVTTKAGTARIHQGPLRNTTPGAGDHAVSGVAKQPRLTIPAAQAAERNDWRMALRYRGYGSSLMH